jgi:starvation-inducible DNA-binding protein
MKPNIGISEKHLKASAALLTEVLATEMVLYVKTRKAHWNVRGESFMELHKLFEAQYSVLELTIDAIAEHIGKMGENTIGSMNEFIKHSKIKEQPGKYTSTGETIKELLTGHETVAVLLRKNIDTAAQKNKDAGTADFFTGIMLQHETAAWVLRRYLSD